MTQSTLVFIDNKMATASNNCENLSKASDVFSLNETDSELQSIFKRLRVNQRIKQISSQHCQLGRCIKKTNLRAKHSRSLQEKAKRRKLVKDATFVFASTKPKRTESKSHKDFSIKDLNDVLPQYGPRQKQITSDTNGGSCRVQGCGEEFRKVANVKVSKDSFCMDDTTPEELASYFDQLLHIPKPMSQMAEMMYT